MTHIVENIDDTEIQISTDEVFDDEMLELYAVIRDDNDEDILGLFTSQEFANIFADAMSSRDESSEHSYLVVASGLGMEYISDDDLARTVAATT